MKDKFGLTKIENPYKIFLRNIQIGIFIILFLFGSLFAGTAIFNKSEDNAFAANYKYTVTLNKNGGSGGTNTIYIANDSWFFGAAGGYWLDSACSSKRMFSGSNPLTIPTRTGYVFQGYYSSLYGGTQRIDSEGYLEDVVATNKLSSNQTWYAHWTPATYQIKIYANTTAFDLNELENAGLTLSSTGTILVSDTQTYTFSSSKQTIGIGTNWFSTYKPYGYIISHWVSGNSFVSATGSNGNSVATIQPNTTGVVTLIAHMKQTKYNITYDYNGGTKGTYNPSSANYYDSVQVSNPTKDGYTFWGWTGTNITTNPTAQYYSSTSNEFVDWYGSTEKATKFKRLNVNDGETVTLKAIFIPTYTVNFEKDGKIYKSQEMMYSFQYFVTDEPTKEGYTFTGWTARNLSSTAKYQLSDASEFKTFTGKEIVKIRQVVNLCSTAGGTVTLVANFSPIKYKITFVTQVDANRNVTESETVTCTYDEAFYYDTPSGFGDVEFLGWKVTGYSRTYENFIAQDLKNAKCGTTATNLSSWDITSSSLWSYRITSADTVYFKNVVNASDQEITLTAQWSSVVVYKTLSDYYSNNKVSLSIDKIPVSVIPTNNVSATYIGLPVLGVFNKSDFSAGSILWAPTSNSRTYTCPLSSSMTYYYVLLDNTCQSEGEWDKDDNNNRYELKISFLKVLDIFGNTKQKINFKIGYTEFDGSGIVSLTKASVNFRLGKKYDFANDYGLSGYNLYTHFADKKIGIDNGRDYLDASNIYFFMDTDQNLWVWDGKKSVDPDIQLTELSKSDRKNGKTVEATYIVEFNDKHSYFKTTDKDKNGNLEKNVFYIDGYACWNYLTKLDNKGFFSEMKGVGLTYTVKLTADIKETVIVSGNTITQTITTGFGQSSSYPFTGTFNGNGHKIGCFHREIENKGKKDEKEVVVGGIKDVTIFKFVDGATIKDLKIGRIAIQNGDGDVEAGTACSALTAKASGTNGESKFEKIEVEEIALEFDGSNGSRGDSRYLSGFGLIGYLENGTVDNCKVKSFAFVNGSGESYLIDLGAFMVGGLGGLLLGSAIQSWWGDDRKWDQTFGTYGEYGISVGGIVGFQYSGTVTNCSVENYEVVCSGKYLQVGGIVGKCLEGTIENCSIGGNASGGEFYTAIGCSSKERTFVGGIVGKLGGEKSEDEITSGTVNNCKNISTLMSTILTSNGNIWSSDQYLNIGGIAGGVFSGTIENSFNMASIYVDMEDNEDGYCLDLNVVAGGIVGLVNSISFTNNNTEAVTIKNCYNLGGLSADYGAKEESHIFGGIIGRAYELDSNNNYKTRITIDNSYSIYDINYNIFKIGKTKGKDHIDGGLVGSVELNKIGTIAFSNCYFASTPYRDASQMSGNGYGNKIKGSTSTSKCYLVYKKDVTSLTSYTKVDNAVSVSVTDSTTFVKTVNIISTIYGFNPSFQSGLPFLVGVGNETIVYDIEVGTINKGDLDSTDYVYIKSTNANTQTKTYRGFGVAKAYTISYYYYYRSYWRFENSLASASFQLSKASRSGDIFIGYGLGTGATSPCTEPVNLSYNPFEGRIWYEKSLYNRDWKDENDNWKSVVEEEKTYATITLKAVFARALEIKSNLNLINGSVETPVANSFIKGNISDRYFVLEYIGTTDGIHTYQFADYGGNKSCTYNDLASTLSYNGVIEKLEGLGLTLAIVKNKDVFSSGFSFGDTHTALTTLAKTTTETLTPKNEGGYIYYCYGYRQVSLYVIEAVEETNEEGETTLTGWKYSDNSHFGYLVYGVQVNFPEFGADPADPEIGGYQEEYDINKTYNKNDINDNDYQISRKGFVLQGEGYERLFGSKDDNSQATTFTLRDLDGISQKILYAVYNQGPSIEIVYHFANGDTSSEILSVSTNSKYMKSGKTYLVSYTFSFANLTNFNVSDPAFAGWWINSTSLGKESTKDDRSDCTYRVNNETSLIYYLANPDSIHLYEKVVTHNGKKVEFDSGYELSTSLVTQGKKRATYYNVASAEDLIWISYYINQGSNTIRFRLTNDIDLSGYSNFYPISVDSSNTFKGTFNGKGYSIKNLTLSANTLLENYSIKKYRTISSSGFEPIIKPSTGLYASSTTITIETNIETSETNGLFAYSNGTISSLNILNTSVNIDGASSVRTGIVVGKNTGKIYNVVADGTFVGTVKASDYYVGGIAGYNSSEISECVSRLSDKYITNPYNVGLLVGWNYTTGTISDCFAYDCGDMPLRKTNSNTSDGAILNVYLQSKIPALKDLDGDIWAQADYINGGKPYLINTGIKTINFKNTCPENAFNGTNNITGASEKYGNVETKDFFILEDYDNVTSGALKIDVYETYLANLFEETSYSGYTFAGFRTEDSEKILTKVHSTYDSKTTDDINVFENNATYYAVWTENTYTLTVEGDTTYSVKFAGKIETSLESICEKLENKVTNKAIDYFEFKYKNNTYYIYRDGTFVTIDNNKKIVSSTTYYGVENFFPYMYDTDITLTPHYYDITYTVYIDSGDGEWKVINSENNIVSTKGIGSDIVKINERTLSDLLKISGDTKEGMYLYLEGNHPVGFSYNENGSVKFNNSITFADLTGYKTNSATINSNNLQEIYDAEYSITLYAIYDVNKYEVTYTAKSTDVLNVDSLGSQTFTYGKTASIYNGNTPSLDGYNFINYEFSYNNFAYYLNSEGYFINEYGERKSQIVNEKTCEKFTPYYFTKDLTIYCVFERTILDINFNYLGLEIYFEVYDAKTNELKQNGLLSDQTPEVRFGDSLKVYYYLNHGTKLNEINVNNNKKLSVGTSLSSCFDSFNSQYFEINNIVEDQKIIFNTNRLEETISLNKNGDYYLISDAGDLYTFFNNYNSSKGKLTNNINLAGYEFSVDSFSGELDGQNFTISGFVVSNKLDQNFGFIKSLTGTLKNVNFDNVIYNINSYIIDIPNYRSVLDCKEVNLINIAIVATENKGTIENVYVLGGKYQVACSGDTKIGLISVNNSGTILSSCADGIDFEVESNKQSSVIIAGLATENGGTIKYCYFEGNIRCEYGAIYGLSSNNSDVFVSYASYNGKSEILNDNDEKFVISNNVKYLAGVNNTIVKVKHSFDDKTNTENLSTYINNSEIDNDEYIKYIYKLNNRVTFNTTNFITNPYALTLQIKKSNNVVSDNFITYVNDNTVDQKTINLEIDNIPNTIKYDLVSTPIEKKLTFTFVMEEKSNFTDKDKNDLLKKLSLYVNNGNEKVFDSFDNGEYTVSISLSYNDNVVSELHLPSWARFNQKTTGVEIDGKEDKVYRGQRDFTYEYSVEKDVEIKFHIERAELTLTIYLNKNDLLASEQEYIKFNSDFYNQTNYKYNADEESVTITIYSSEDSEGNSVYYAPSIENMFDYDKLGVHYKFMGLFDKDGNQYYNANYINLIEKLVNNYEVYVKWEAVNYTLVLEIESDYGYSHYNGYSQRNEYAYKILTFGQDLTNVIPYAYKYNYNFAYKFEGLKIGENNNQPVYALTLDENGDIILFDKYLSRTWTNYALSDILKENQQIRLQPEFTMIEFEVTIYSQGTIFTSKGTEQTNGGVFADGTTSQTLKITIIDYLNMKKNSYADIPVPSLEHYVFNGYYVDNPNSLVLKYSNNNFSAEECLELLSNISLYSAYETTYVSVSIHAQDAYTNESVPFNVITSEDVEHYDIINDNVGGIVFSLEYNSTNFTLPEIESVSKEYTFVSYYVKDHGIYDKNYVFTSNVDIYLACNYKVTLKTYGASLTSDVFTEEIANQVYYTFVSSPILKGTKTVTLPNLELGEYTLQGYKINGQTYNVNAEVEIKEPTIIDSVWTGKIVTINLNGNGAKLPSSISNFEGLMGYELVDDTNAKIQVIHNTQGSLVKNALPELTNVGKTFEKYVVSDTNEDLGSFTFEYANDGTNEVNIEAKFIDNSYTIRVIRNDTTVAEVTSNYNERVSLTIDTNFEGLDYVGLSLNKEYFNLFEIPETMPYLEEDYQGYVSITNNSVVLEVYAYYTSGAIVKINAYADAKINNTTGLSNFTGGELFNNPASFKLTVENILNLDFSLPIPETQNELSYATFKGYYGYNENNEYVQMANENGVLTNNFKYKEGIVLSLEFETGGYTLTLNSEYSKVIKLGDFEQSGSQFTRYVQFGETVGTLPVVELENYTFKGFYFSKNTDNLYVDSDEQLSDKDGKLVSGYTTLTMAYINKLDAGYLIVAKYDQTYAEVNIQVNNSALGTVDIPRNEQGVLISNVALEFTQTELGYTFRIPYGTTLLITANSIKGVKFTEWTQDKDLTIVNPTENTTSILNITKDVAITANFDYINYNITYYLNNEELTDITPSTFNISENVILPELNIEGYDFIGWYLEKSLVTKIESINAGEIVKDLAVYAKIQNKDIEISIYSSLDDYSTASTFNATYKKKLESLKDYNKTQANYTFVGFFTEEDGLGYAVNEQSLCTFSSNFNLYALYTTSVVNQLEGNGTQTNPYKISNAEDLINFANLINFDLFNSTSTYFKLVNNIEIELSQLITIGNGVQVGFKATFDGGNHVIYIHGENFNSNFVLNENGTIETYNGLFGINNGKISNLIVVSDVQLSENFDENYSQIVGTICATNNGLVNNCIAYAKLQNNTSNNVTSGNISAVKSEQAEESSNTSIVVVEDETTYISSTDAHYHSSNVSKPSISKNSYYIYSEKDLAWLSAQSKIDYDVYLMNNLNMEGKIFSQIKLNSNFYGNGYTISNLLIIDGTSFIETVNTDCVVSKVNFENVALFNFVSNVSLIENNNGTLEKILVLGITNNVLLVNENNSKIENVYSVSAQNVYNVVNINNNTIENSYSYLNNFVVTNNGTLNNVYNMNAENYDEIYESIQTNFDIDTTTSIWLTDENNVMFDIKLPVLKGVGNIYLTISAPDEFSVLSVVPFNAINNVVLLKTYRDIKLNFEITESYLHIDTLTLNGSNILKNKVGNSIYIYSSNLTVENELTVSLTKNIINIEILVETSSQGNIKYEDDLYKRIKLEVEYGTIIDFEAIAIEGYRFSYWSDEITSSARSITAEYDFSLIAYFERIYKVEVYYNANDVVCVDKHDNFTETDYGLFGIFVASDFDTFESLCPTLTRTNYVLSGFTTANVSDGITIRLTANWEIDYITVQIVANSSNYEMNITSNSKVDDISVVKKNSTYLYYVLRNCDATFTLNLTGAYLTQMLINGSDIYSAENYESFKTSSEPIVVDLSTYTYDNITIEFSSNDIIYNTYFASSSDYSISFKNNLKIYADEDNENINLRNYVSTLKGTQVIFGVNLDVYKSLEQVKLFNLSGEELENKISVVEQFGEFYYSFTSTEDAIIVIETTNKQYSIKVSYTNGGKVISNIQIDEENKNDNSFSFVVNYNDTFNLYVDTNKGYKLSEVIKIVDTNQTSLSLSNSYIISNVNSDMEIIFNFSSQTTWLTVDNEDNPINFKLTELKGAGEQNNPYLINNIRDFLTMAYNVNILNESYSGKIFKVVSKDLTFDFSQYNFMPIGTDTTIFDGTILGNNLTLKGIRIENGTNVGVFSELGANAVVKSINVLGTIKANNLVASIAGTNNGTILGCSSGATIIGLNELANENNIIAGICAVNNGKIYQSSFAGNVNGCANILAGLCGINNGEILNVYNTANVELTKNNQAENIYVAGLVGQNKGTLKFGYNSSQVKATGENVTLNAVTYNTGVLSDVYYNSSILTAESDIGLTSSKLKDETNEIYQTWDFETIWYFDEKTYDFPKLQTIYEFSGTINFKANFDNSISTKVLFVTLTNTYGESYDIVLNANKLTASIEGLSAGTYTITLRTAYNVSLSETTKTLEMNEANGKEYPVEISLIKMTNAGYCSSILI